MKNIYLDLMREGEDISYAGYSLDWLFTSGEDPYPER